MDPGTLLGERFRLGEHLRRSRQGELHAATDEQAGLDCEVEVLSVSGFAGEELARWVAREVDLGARLHGEGLLVAVAWGSLGPGRLWVARLAPGERQPLDLSSGELEERVWRVLSAARRVEALAARGCVHRNLGPLTLLQAGDEVHVSGFQLAKLDGVSEPPLDLRGLPFAWLPCAAPELLDDPEVATERADVFALGSLLHQALTGAYPFPGPTLVDLVRQHAAAEQGGALARLDGELPGALRELCARALATDPAARLASAGALADELENWLAVGGSGAHVLETKPTRRLGDGLDLEGLQLAEIGASPEADADDARVDREGITEAIPLPDLQSVTGTLPPQSERPFFPEDERDTTTLVVVPPPPQGVELLPDLEPALDAPAAPPASGWGHGAGPAAEDPPAAPPTEPVEGGADAAAPPADDEALADSLLADLDEAIGDGAADLTRTSRLSAEDLAELSGGAAEEASEPGAGEGDADEADRAGDAEDDGLQPLSPAEAAALLQSAETPMGEEAPGRTSVLSTVEVAALVESDMGPVYAGDSDDGEEPLSPDEAAALLESDFGGADEDDEELLDDDLSGEGTALSELLAGATRRALGEPAAPAAADGDKPSGWDPFASDDGSEAEEGDEPAIELGEVLAPAGAAPLKPSAPVEESGDDLGALDLTLSADPPTAAPPPPAGAPPPAPAPLPNLPEPEMEQVELVSVGELSLLRAAGVALIARVEGKRFEELVDQVKRVDSEGFEHLLLDMGKVPHLGGNQLEALSEVAYLARRKHLGAGMFGLRPSVRTFLGVVEFDAFLPPTLSATDEAEALAEAIALDSDE
jgi:serine/threonine-protein kinase